MITVEADLGEIEKLHSELLKIMRKMSDSFGQRTAENRTTAIKGLSSMIRKLELLLENVRKMENPTTKPYIERMEESLKDIKILSLNEDKLPTEYHIHLHLWARWAEQKPRGVCTDLLRQRYGVAYCTFCYLSKPLFSFLEDVKLLQSLMIFPSELKADVRDRLSKLGFIDVSEGLDGADENFIMEHRKDCVDNCRKALMKTVEYIVSKIGRKATSKFERNMNELVEAGMLDDVDKRDIVSVFSFLTQKSQHELLESKTKMTNEDANYTIGLTYSKIRRLLDKLSELEKAEQETEGIPS